MNIAVIAANGRSGRAFVTHALAAGHTIHAGSRSVGQLPSHPNLIEIECDATKESDVLRLIDGQDAVASFIGHVKGSDATVQTDATQNIVAVMQKTGVSRIVSLTGTGVRFPHDDITFMDKLLNTAVGIVDPPRVKDGREHVEVLKQSGLEWTVIRVLKLENIASKPFSLKVGGPTKLVVSREDVAKAALSVLEEHSFIRQAPIISRPE